MFVKDVKADGNCGFRAIAGLLGFGEDAWINVRQNLIDELRTFWAEYVELFGGYDRRLIDFGSAIDDFSLRNLYGSNGPSENLSGLVSLLVSAFVHPITDQTVCSIELFYIIHSWISLRLVAQETYAYAPPEVLANPSWFKGPSRRGKKYDMWSVGAMILDMVVGGPIFHLTPSTMHDLAFIQFPDLDQYEIELLYKLEIFEYLCIRMPAKAHKFMRMKGIRAPPSMNCSNDLFSDGIRNLDPLGMGFTDELASDLVRQLLKWEPVDRLNVEEALAHPYFRSLNRI
ncbi:probable inactive protein kinase At3g63330 [Tripterygium wilfordii]|uniref:probable inactive protein kinase At3g63330 n=1 Tax=Tripterygium wilfordii TaxID=458696 RepID=UPI0018F801DD|nr:probable inactive protein kinase At3g63330 [Tripterygium wilfordii]